MQKLKQNVYLLHKTMLPFPVKRPMVTPRLSRVHDGNIQRPTLHPRSSVPGYRILPHSFWTDRVYRHHSLRHQWNDTPLGDFSSHRAVVAKLLNYGGSSPIRCSDICTHKAELNLDGICRTSPSHGRHLPKRVFQRQIGKLLHAGTPLPITNR